MCPLVGASSPPMSRSNVDLPAPLIPTRPQRPAGTSTSNSEKTGVPSGQAKLTDDRLIAGLDIREAPKRQRSGGGRPQNFTTNLSLGNAAPTTVDTSSGSRKRIPSVGG